MGVDVPMQVGFIAVQGVQEREGTQGLCQGPSALLKAPVTDLLFH